MVVEREIPAIWTVLRRAGNGMKLAKFLFSVNLAAAIPVAVQASASAHDEAVNRDGWLKDSIASLDKSGQPDSGKQTQISKAINQAKTKASTQDLGAKIVMRPFVPNRKLPHRWELEGTLKAQEPKMAPDPVNRLNGVVSGYFQPSETRSTISALNTNAISPTAASGLKRNKTHFERVAEMTRNLIKVIPTGSQAMASAAVNPHANNTGNSGIDALKNLSLATRNQTQVAPESGFPMLQSAEKVLFANDNKAGEQDSPTSIAAIREQQAIAELSVGENEQSPEREFGTMNSAGPPPFPLNLLPEETLKNFVRGLGPTHTSTPRVYFGSWHRSATMSTLPPGGFKNYSLSTSQRRRSFAVPRSSAASNSVAPKAKNRSTPLSKQFLVSRTAEPRTATYPAYRLSTGLY
jgi:hypothetical protein